MNRTSKNPLPGHEQYQEFHSASREKSIVQYNYRAPGGKLFTCVKPTLEECRIMRDEWCQKHGVEPPAGFLSPEETMGHLVKQDGVPPGPERLALFHKALTLRDIGPLYSQDGVEEKTAHVKFFDPCGSWTWYATEWDGQNRCFGYVEGHESEWGYFDIKELASIKGPLGIGIEVDVYFKPQPVPIRELNQKINMTTTTAEPKPHHPSQGDSAQKLPEITPIIRENLLKYFQAKNGERPLSQEQFNEVKVFVDYRKGGFTREAYEMVKGDQELVKAASISQAHRDHRIMDKAAPEVRETLLKALNAKPGEKPLSAGEFRDVAIFMDRKNGGIRRHGFQIFKDDKEIVNAAAEHRSRWKEHSKALEKTPEKTPSQKKTKETTFGKFIKKRTKGMSSAAKGQEVEQGE